MLEAIKHYYRVSNYSLAAYVGVSESQMHSVRTNRRSLSAEAILSFAQLYKALEKDKSLTQLSTVQAFLNEETVDLSRLIHKTEKALKSRRNRLQKLEQERQAALRALHACTQLLQSGKQSLREEKWLRLRVQHLRLDLSERSLELVLRLQSETLALETQLAYLNTASKEN